MSVSVSRSDGLTILTLTSDQSSVCPPFCQLLGALCYSPGCCSGKSRLAPHRLGAQTVLGALWIITGLLQIGLSVLLVSTDSNLRWWLMWEFGQLPYWLGVVFVVIGVCCVLAERFPRPVFVLLSGLLNLAGVALSITAIVFFSRGVYSARWNWNDCVRDRSPYRSRYRSYDYGRWNTPATTTVAPDYRALVDVCEAFVRIRWALTASVYAVLICVSVLNLCVALSSSIISFKTLKQRKNKALLEETKATTKEM